MTNHQLLHQLNRDKTLEHSQWVQLFATYTPEDLQEAMALARQITQEQFGNQIYFRGIIEFTNYCRNDCFYCGIRRSNHQAARYRLTLEEILECCQLGYDNGLRTFVLQGGEDGYFTEERIAQMILAIRRQFPDCAITLSVGEWPRRFYETWYQAGADRYLLRHETICPDHYGLLHPAEMTIANRVRCLEELRAIGYQVGCGIMVGSPGQTSEHLAMDMAFMAQFQPHMVGIGPFLPHSQTPFADCPAGSVETTLLALALTRILLPQVLLPATTALGTAENEGQKRGIQAGCNVIMPNLSPVSVRKKYMLYNNKLGTSLSADQGIGLLKAAVGSMGCQIVVGRGDHPACAEYLPRERSESQ